MLSKHNVHLPESIYRMEDSSSNDDLSSMLKHVNCVELNAKYASK